MGSKLFEPISFRGLTLANRIVIPPLCQYSSVDGDANDWHLVHLGHLAFSGAGLLIIEATGVEASGRITRECLGLYSDSNERTLGDVIHRVRQLSGIPIAIQLAHAGRKASTYPPAAKERGGLPPEAGAWPVDGPSAVSFNPTYLTPRELDRAGMDRVVAAFVQATRRSLRIGFDAIEIHSAHGYLLSSFLSPIANRRTDEYGGSLENRMRLPLEVFKAVRAACPDNFPVGVRFSGTDWKEGGITIDEAVVYARELGKLGCDFVDVSSGGNAETEIPQGLGYQVPLAERVKAECGVTTIAVGLIREPLQAEEILEKGQADMIAVGRGMLYNPRWPWHAAEELGEKIVAQLPIQYQRWSRSTNLNRPARQVTIENAAAGR